MQERPNELKVQRSQPVQGHLVEMRVLWNGEVCAVGSIPFDGWIRLKKLLEGGIEQDAKADYPLGVRLKIEGMSATQSVSFAPAPKISKQVQPQTWPTVDEFPQSEDPDGDLREALNAAETDAEPVVVPAQVRPGMIKTLRGKHDDAAE